MLLYEDIITGDELFSDAFPLKEVDGIVYEVDCQMITVKAGADIDIGANPSAEEQEEALEEGATQVNNGYMKAVKEKLNETEPDKVQEFEKGAAAYAKKIIANFKDFEFYTGESMNPDGMVALLNYREDGITPYFTFWKHGTKQIKL
ncbi:hypothetical protein CVT26_003708 [Gymnopilus dilepis]|uniref:Translationally-controlled tumor protein homolog n=1 Tax=Gymnopilus dilepis TaxID=231916 RepID=A0A409W248_9AGAR|nr:hypothetical protein CVT26_003708 [Gymnopilus dilepis]